MNVEEFYARTHLPIGTTVYDNDDPARVGQIVKRGGRFWVNRDKLPLVRWHGKIDAEPVPWERISTTRVATAESVFGTGDCDKCGAMDVPIGWMADNDYSLCFACLPAEHERLREENARLHVEIERQKDAKAQARRLLDQRGRDAADAEDRAEDLLDIIERLTYQPGPVTPETPCLCGATQPAHACAYADKARWDAAIALSRDHSPTTNDGGTT